MSDEIKAKAKAALEAFVRSGMSSEKALKKVQAQYVDDVVDVMKNEINALKIGTITRTKLKDMAVGEIDLSTNLYNHTRYVNANVMREINNHAKGAQNARELALKIYEGYDFNASEVLKVKKDIPKYLLDPLKQMNSKNLKTPALKAAYLKLIDAKSDADLERSLKVALEERNRYFANRIAQTELHRIQTQAKVREILSDEGVDVIQIRMSVTHPKVDICDYHSGLDAYGLGAGCYPKHLAPMPPYHPFCKCRAVPRVDLSASDRKETDGDPEKNLMGKFDESEQSQIVGSSGLLNLWKQGRGSVTQLADKTRKPIYHLKNARDIQFKAFVPDLKGDELMELDSGDIVVNDVASAIKKGREIISTIEGKHPIEIGGVISFESVTAFRGELLSLLDSEVGTQNVLKNRAGNNKKALSIIDRASKRFPNSWTDAISNTIHVYHTEAYRGFRQSISWIKKEYPVGTKYPLRLQSKKTGKVKKKHLALNNTHPIRPMDDVIVTSGGSTVEHELGHSIQSALPELDAIFQDLHKMRTKGDSLEQLRVIENNANYRADEVTRKDGYYRSYQGKEYNGSALEVLTMSLEPILGGYTNKSQAKTWYSKFKEFYKKDRELFEMTVGLLFGWSP